MDKILMAALLFMSYLSVEKIMGTVDCSPHILFMAVFGFSILVGSVVEWILDKLLKRKQLVM